MSVRFPWGAVECCQCCDQLRNGHAKLRRPQLKHVRGTLVDLDTDVGVAFARIHERRLVSLNFASWNQLDGWLRLVEGLRRAA